MTLLVHQHKFGDKCTCSATFWPFHTTTGAAYRSIKLGSGGIGGDMVAASGLQLHSQLSTRFRTPLIAARRYESSCSTRIMLNNFQRSACGRGLRLNNVPRSFNRNSGGSQDSQESQDDVVMRSLDAPNPSSKNSSPPPDNTPNDQGPQNLLQRIAFSIAGLFAGA